MTGGLARSKIGVSSGMHKPNRRNRRLRQVASDHNEAMSEIDENETNLDSSGDEGLICPECETVNSRGAVLCAGCRQPIDPETIEERRARRRHPTARESRRAAKRSKEKSPAGRRRSEDDSDGVGGRLRSKLSGDPGELDDDVLLWHARLPASEILKREIPEWTYSWITRERLRNIAIGAGVALLLVAFLLWPDGAKVERSGGLGLTFTRPSGWSDISQRSDWPGHFTLGPKVADEETETDLAIERGPSALAVIDSSPISDSLSPESLRTKAESIRLLYELSSNTRPGSIREVTYFGEAGFALSGEHLAGGERRQEEMIVLAYKGRETIILMSAPLARWPEDREAMEEILGSAE